MAEFRTAANSLALKVNEKNGFFGGFVLAETGRRKTIAHTQIMMQEHFGTNQNYHESRRNKFGFPYITL